MPLRKDAKVLKTTKTTLNNKNNILYWASASHALTQRREVFKNNKDNIEQQMVTKLRPSSTGLHGVSTQSRAFDPPCFCET